MLNSSTQTEDYSDLDAIIAGGRKKSAVKAEGGAISGTKPGNISPRPTSSRRKVAKPQATPSALPKGRAPAAPHSDLPGAGCSVPPMGKAPPEGPHEIPEARKPPQSRREPPRETPLPGQLNHDPQRPVAGQNLSASDGGADEGQRSLDAHPGNALVGSISIVFRRYNDMRRARQSLELQAIATCRSLSDGDKVAGLKLYKAVCKDPGKDIDAYATIMPYLAAMEPLVATITKQEKELTKLGTALPVAEWADGISGLSPRFLAMIVGASAATALDGSDRLIGPGEFKTVSALWKRMGMAVINGKRQCRVAGDAAIEQGYDARRRSLMWNIGESIIKQQVRNPKGEDGKPTGDAFAIGEYGQLYLDRKLVEATKSDKPIVIHSRAKRYMEKRLLRELWRAWRRGQGLGDNQGISAPPPTDLPGEAVPSSSPNRRSPHPADLAA